MILTWFHRFQRTQKHDAGQTSTVCQFVCRTFFGALGAAPLADRIGRVALIASAGVQLWRDLADCWPQIAMFVLAVSSLASV